MRARPNPRPPDMVTLARAILEAQREGSTLVVVNSSKGDALVDDRLIEARLSESGIDFWIERSAQGTDAADEFLRVAQARQAELIAIGLRKRTPMGKFIMGSTAQRILLQATCPVLSLKAEQN